MNDGCAPYRPLISPALDRALAPREQEALEQHLAFCAECRSAKVRLQTTVQLLRAAVLVSPTADFVERLEARLEVPVRAEEAASRAPTLVLSPANPRRGLYSALKTGALVLCLGTSSFLAMEAFTRSRGAPARTVKTTIDLEPVPQPPAPPQSPAPPPLIAPPPPIHTTTEPDVPIFTNDELTRIVDSQFKNPAVENPTPPLVVDPAPPPPPPVVVETPAPPPPATDPGSRTVDKTPRASALVTNTKKVDEAALGRLLALIFEDPSTPPNRRPEMLAALSEFPAKKAYEALTAVLGGALDAKPQAPACRAAAWEALGAFGNEDSVKLLLAVTARDDTRLLAALSHVKEAKAVLFLADRAKDHPQVDTRILIARALGKAGKREAVAGLVKVLADAKQETLLRSEAALALGAIGDPSALEALRAALSPAKSKLPAIRAAAARGLGLLALGAAGANAAKALVEPLEKDPHAVVREACALALGRSRQLEVALKPLVDRLDPHRERSVRVRAAAEAALVELTGAFHTFDEWKKLLADAAKGAQGAQGGNREGALDGVGLRKPGAIALARTSWARLVAGQGTVVVLDRSGSMEQSGKMLLAKKTALDVIDALPVATDRDPVGFSIVGFADAATAFFPRLIEPSPENRAKAAAAIDRQRPYWARTDLLRAVRCALAIEGVDSIVLVTDGLPTLGVSDPEQLLLEVSRANASIGARIHVVALRDGSSPLELDTSAVAPAGENPEVTWMRRLALDNNGMFVKN